MKCLSSLGFVGFILSTALVLLCIAMFSIGFFTTNSEASLSVYESAFCKNGEQIERIEGSETEHFDRQTNRRRTTRHVAYACQSASGDHDITGSVAAVQILSFLVPFVTLFGVVIGGLTIYFKSGGGKIDTDSWGNSFFSKKTYTAEEIEAKLAKLQKLVDKGLVSAERYQEVEQELRSHQV